jgi:ribosomal protein S18 acetylase RimI-like enzyme
VPSDAIAIAERTGRLTVAENLSPSEERLFTALLMRSLPRHYDGVDVGFPRSIISAAAGRHDPEGSFTTRKRLFVGRDNGTAIAFTVATYKHGGAVKMGPTVVKPEFRRMRYATELREMVEEIMLGDFRVRKFYLTVTADNPEALYFNLSLGYAVEGTLKDQYAKGKTELILVRTRAQVQAARSIPWLPATQAELVLRVNDASPEVRDYVMKRASNLYGELSSESVRSLLGPESVNKVVVSSHQASGIGGLAIFAHKRGGATKMAPFLADNAEAADLLLERAINFARQKGDCKLCTVLSTNDVALLVHLVRRGFVIEARVTDMYAATRDAFLLGLEVEHG